MYEVSSQKSYFVDALLDKNSPTDSSADLVCSFILMLHTNLPNQYGERCELELEYPVH